MPLPAQIRRLVNDYLFKHIVPKTIRPRPQTAMEWFEEQFQFIDDVQLQKHLAEAFYQARYLGRFCEALGLPATFNRAFVKAQVVLYASIFEAIIDRGLETKIEDAIVVEMLSAEEYVPVDGALAKGISLVHGSGTDTVPLSVCKVRKRRRPLQLVRFEERVDAAHKLGLVPADLVDFIKTLYQSRNGIHVLNAAKHDLKPDANESTEAFKNLHTFLRHSAKWFHKGS